ncbi:hypothetical protein HMPREF3216_00220 [Gardnerella vaginalis]|uniref:Uncharacterized protein n=1 Tax=Gardnerella vaginalis TaxID=2702 RepID=A0A133NRX8_GARVA|nr:hypothetical protein HMPREF3216_00220 [Gardnerella vaginalis]
MYVVIEKTTTKTSASLKKKNKHYLCAGLAAFAEAIPTAAPSQVVILMY